jgi:hypothetical protein
MKCKNNPAELLEYGEMLPFVQQFGFWADRRRELLYYGQEFMKVTGSPPQKADESKKSGPEVNPVRSLAYAGVVSITELISRSPQCQLK